MSKTMLQFAEGKYVSFKALLQCNEDIDTTAILGFEAVERYLKHIYTCTTGTPDATHNLKTLCRQMGRHDLITLIDPIRDMYFERNYPTADYYELSEKELVQLTEIVEQVRAIALKYTLPVISTSSAFTD